MKHPLGLLDDPLRLLKPRALKHLSEQLWQLVRTRLWAKILAGMALGTGMGIALGPNAALVSPRTSSAIASWAALPGQLFLALIQMIVIPLIFASIIRGLAAGEDVEQLRRLGPRLGGYFVTTTTVAISIGMGMAALIKPGSYVDAAMLRGLAATAPQPSAPAELPSAREMLTNLIPTNPLQAMVEGQMLQIVLFTVVIGVALVQLAPEHSRPLLVLLGSLQRVCMTVVRWALRLAPIAVAGLMLQLTSQLGLDVLAGLGAYVGTVLLALAAMLVVYLIVASVLGKGPIEFMRAARDVQLLAFSTSSSAAAMPLSLETAEERLRVRPSIARVLIPLGATINMDGTALYQGAATVFLAQVFDVDLSAPQLVLVAITAVLASIGAPSAPGAGIVILGIVLASAGIPAEGIALLIGVDRLLDMSRTSINVTGDLIACLALDRWVGATRSADEELDDDAKLQARRRESGEDIIVRAAP